jgi:hypothetical protein
VKANSYKYLSLLITIQCCQTLVTVCFTLTVITRFYCNIMQYGMLKFRIYSSINFAKKYDIQNTQKLIVLKEM